MSILMGIATPNGAWEKAQAADDHARALYADACLNGAGFAAAADAFDVAADAWEAANHGRLASGAAYWALRARRGLGLSTPSPTVSS